MSSGVDLVGKTGQALQRIVGEVGKITELVTEIAASAQEQAVGLGQVNTAINEMDQMTQQNAAMVEQSTAASHALAHQASELDQLMEEFEIGEARGRAQASRRGQATRSEPARGPISMGATARKLAVVPAADTWEEF